MNRIDWEKRTVRHMIELWCRKNHGGKACCEMGSRGSGLVSQGGQGLCGECRELLEYSLARLEHCKFGNAKTKCHKCPVHCYRPDMREKIRTVMRFSGPRMLLYHPLEALRYLFSR